MFFKRPNFATPVEEQIPFQNLTEEEKLFLREAHLDVEVDAEEETDDQNDEPERDANENGDAYFDDDKLSLEETLKLLDDISSPADDSNEETNVVTFKSAIDAGPSSVLDLDSNNFISNNEEQVSFGDDDVFMNDKNLVPLRDDKQRMSDGNHQLHKSTENNQIRICDGKENQMANPVSPYYTEFYRKRFGCPPCTITSETPVKRMDLQEIRDNKQETGFFNRGITEYFNRTSLYPMELFGEKSGIENTYYPAKGDTVDYRTNPAMNKGTAVFSSGFWRKGVVIQVDRCDRRGTLYTVQDDLTGNSFQINRYQIKERTA